VDAEIGTEGESRQADRRTGACRDRDVAIIERLASLAEPSANVDNDHFAGDRASELAQLGPQACHIAALPRQGSIQMITVSVNASLSRIAECLVR
jgi:hypothetical protein